MASRGNNYRALGDADHSGTPTPAEAQFTPRAETSGKAGNSGMGKVWYQ